MVAHEDKRVEQHPEAAKRTLQHLQKSRAIFLISEDTFTPVTAPGEMIQRALEFKTKRTGHTA